MRRQAQIARAAQRFDAAQHRSQAAGDLRLAAHLAEFAVLAEPSSREAHELRAAVYEARAALEPSSMARGIFSFAAGSSRQGKKDAFQRD